MTLDKKMTVKADQQITLWLQRLEKERQLLQETELRSPVMEVVHEP